MTPTIPRLERALKEVKIFYLICLTLLLFKLEERGEKKSYYLKTIFAELPLAKGRGGNNFSIQVHIKI